MFKMCRNFFRLCEKQDRLFQCMWFRVMVVFYFWGFGLTVATEPWRQAINHDFKVKMLLKHVMLKSKWITSFLSVRQPFLTRRVNAQSLTCATVVYDRLKMVCVQWLLVVLMVFVNIPGFGTVCWYSALCNNLSSDRRIRVRIKLLLFLFFSKSAWVSKMEQTSGEEHSIYSIYYLSLYLFIYLFI